MADSQLRLSKFCRKCQTEKLVTEFSKQSNGKYGVQSICRECRRVAGREYMRQVRAGIIQQTKRVPVTVDGMKRCPQCKETKPLTEFPADKNTKDGRFSYCRPCGIAYDRKKRAKRSDRDAIRVALLNDRDRAKVDENSKWCRRCQQVKAKEGFGADKKRSDGLACYCRECSRVIVRMAQRESRKNPERKEREKKRLAIYRSTEEYKAKRATYRSRPEVKERERMYRQSQSGKQVSRKSRQKWARSPEFKEKRKAYQSLPHVQTRRKAYAQSPKGRLIHRRATAHWFRRLREGTVLPSDVDDKTQLMIAEYESGKSTYEVAKLFGTYATDVAYRLLRAGIVLRSRSEYSHPAKPRFGPDNHNWLELPTEEIKRLYDLGLTTVEIGNYFGVSATPITNRLKAMGVKLRSGLGMVCTGEDGHVLRSSLERAVCNWLTTHGLNHSTEPVCPWCRGYSNRPLRGDFLVGETYIEVWGLNGNDSYDRNSSYKRRKYAMHGISLIELYPTDILYGDLKPLHVLLEDVVL